MLFPSGDLTLPTPCVRLPFKCSKAIHSFSPVHKYSARSELDARETNVTGSWQKCDFPEARLKIQRQVGRQRQEDHHDDEASLPYIKILFQPLPPERCRRPNFKGKPSISWNFSGSRL